MNSVNAGPTTCGQCSKLIGAFVAILMATHKEKDSKKVLSTTVDILGSIAPEVLQEQAVRKSLGLDPCVAKATEPSWGLERATTNAETDVGTAHVPPGNPERPAETQAPVETTAAQ